MATFQKYSISMPTFGVYQGTAGYLKDTAGNQIYLGFEDTDKNFIGNNNIHAITNLAVDKSDAGVSVYTDEKESTNTASKIKYMVNDTANTTYYTIAYNNKNLFRLSVGSHQTKVSCKVWLTLVDFSSVQFNDESLLVTFALFQNNYGNFNISRDTNRFDLLQATLDDYSCAIFCWTENYEINSVYNAVDVKTSNGNVPFDLDRYKNCYIYTLNNEVAYNDTTGKVYGTLDFNSDYYIFYYESDGYMRYFDKYLPARGIECTYTKTI